MKQIKCPNCGAKISSKSYICDYCGTEIVTEQKTVKQQNQHTAFYLEQFNSIRKKQQSGSKSVLIAFLVVWVGSAVFGAVQVATNFSVFAAIPFLLIGFFGVVLVSAGIKSAGKQIDISDTEDKQEKK
jgi:predicted amidophosphoribosyltransferase